jgi:hypothetical protein
MQSWIKEKLDKIDELFPAERISASIKRWTDLWNGVQPDRQPYCLGIASFGVYDDIDTPSERLRKTLDEILLHGVAGDDMVPSVFPGCRQATIPNMFGAKEIVVGNDRSAEPIIADISDIDRLPAPSIAKGTIAYEWLEMQRYFLEETEGRLPVHVTDMQGPADVCGNLWGYGDFLSAAYMEPDAYHAIMSIVTDAFIMLWDAQKTLLGDNFIGTHLFGWSYVPPDAGASISADSLVMISPDFYDEFYRPYLEQIGTKFGGMSVHSCGDFSAVIPRMLKTPNLKAVNAGQMSINQMVKAGLDSTVLAIAGMSMTDLSEVSKSIQDNSLRADVTIHGALPVDETGRAKLLEEWTEDDYEFVKRKRELILGAFCS